MIFSFIRYSVCFPSAPNFTQPSSACAIHIKYVCKYVFRKNNSCPTELKPDELRVTQTTLVPTMPWSFPTVLGQGINGMKGHCNTNRFSFYTGQYLCFCSVTETDAAAMLFSTPSDTMASHLTIHGHRFWVDLQNRSFEMSLFCSHFPRSYLVLMFLSGNTSESWMKTNWVIIRG